MELAISYADDTGCEVYVSREGKYSESRRNSSWIALRARARSFGVEGCAFDCEGVEIVPDRCGPDKAVEVGCDGREPLYCGVLNEGARGKGVRAAGV